MNANNHFSKKSLATATDKELDDEVQSRKENDFSFPLWVFPDAIKPMIHEMIDRGKLELVPEFVGLAFLRCYSVAIGTAYMVETGFPNPVCLAIWGAFIGKSSSGKSMVQGIVDMPLHKKQKALDEEFDYECQGKSAEQIATLNKKTIVLRQSVMPTILSSVLPQNPKGILKDTDEILEFINGMNAGSKNGIGNEEEIWMSMWNGQYYNKQLSKNVYYKIPRMYASITGGIQPGILWKMWQKDRGVTGFVFRFLLALPQKDKKVKKNVLFKMEDKTMLVHDQCVNFLYDSLPVTAESNPKLCVLTYEAKLVLQEWMDRREIYLEAITDVHQSNLVSGIQGKMEEYVYRIAGILRLMYFGFEHMNNKTFQGFPKDLSIDVDIIKKAIAVTDYFEASAIKCCEIVANSSFVSEEAMIVANMTKRDCPLWEIGSRIRGIEGSNEAIKKTLAEWARKRRIKLMKEYPSAFDLNIR